MDFFTIEQLRAAMPGSKPAAVDLHFPLMLAAMLRFEINTPVRIAAFISQVGHECLDLSRFEENLNYSAVGLRKTFPKYFPSAAKAAAYARQPEKIANLVYANRMGNGSPETGDGWRYRGRGGIMITGKENYLRYGRMVGVDLGGFPDLAAKPPTGWMVAGAYWERNQLNAYADKGNFKGLTRAINGGLNGLEDRERRLDLAEAALGIV
jgi:putative chitinase